MEGYISEIRMFAANFAPRNWAYCQGQTISITSNSALFSLLGTTYGGNGSTTFQLPNFASRQARGTGGGGGLSPIELGEMGGSESSTMNINTMPSHGHAALVKASSNSNNGSNPVGGGYGAVNIQVAAPPGITATGTLYSSTANASMSPNMVAVGTTGSGAPFTLLNPYTAMNYIICMFGIYPSRS
jgi:microcystin-dependent protein